MREIEKKIEVNELKKVEKILTLEEITSYSINKDLKTIKVDIRQTSADSDAVFTEVYEFGGEVFLENANETDLWRMIDKRRNGD